MAGTVDVWMNWELGISRCKLLHIKWINNKVLLYSTGNYIQYPLINHNGGTSLVAQWLRIHLPMQGTQVEPWSRKIPHAAEQLSPRATTTEPACHNYWSLSAYSPCSATREATAIRSLRTARKTSPCLPQLEKACTQAMKTQCSQK